MLTIPKIIENLPAHLVHASEGYQDIAIESVVAGDMMSDILLSVEKDYLLVTSLATDQVLRTADIMGAMAILLVNDKLPSAAMKEEAEDMDITLMATPLPMFEACASLANLLAFS